jgi:class 3 adenylate cyclase
MTEERVERRLTAILAADVAGYSRLMGVDEEGTLAALKTLRREVADPKIREHRGRIVNTTGDGLLSEFASVVDAVRCAVEVQREMAARNTGVQADRRIDFRIGINLGDIMFDENDIFGDGVNVAARLEALAEPGGICVSRVVRDQVRDKLAISFEDMGEQQVKNIARPVRPIALFSQRGPKDLRCRRRRRRRGCCPTGPRSQSSRLTTSVAIPNRNISSTALPRTSSLRCRNGAGFSSSPAIPRSPTKENPST